MDKATLEELKKVAENKCAELFKQVSDLTAELERTRGDFRTLDSLLLRWQEPAPMPVIDNQEPVIAQPAEVKSAVKRKPAVRRKYAKRKVL